MQDDYQQRFGGITRLYGQLGAEALQQAHVALIGVGGVGSWCCEALVRSGIGALTLIDPDDIARSNTNRQLHTLETTLGRSKVAVMAERMALIHPHCDINAIDDRLSITNIGRLLPAGVTVVIDCIDRVSIKAALIGHCKVHRLPIVTTGGAGGQIEPAKIGVVDLSRTSCDPLAAKVRALLRRHYHFPRNPKRKFQVACVSSTEQPRYPTIDGATTFRKPSSAATTLDCQTGYGAVTMVTASFGLHAAAEAVRLIIQQPALASHAIDAN
ncbi:tRNA threonylcarbamoyladenosine dehydratase [Ectothiorhodospiraceae bacterium BW-2]|nr:tRNA threonylcarbamoyladenosine dehydratase [Ectothiorhodospiraceae bacterium BW-2]